MEKIVMGINSGLISITINPCCCGSVTAWVMLDVLFLHGIVVVAMSVIIHKLAVCHI